MGRVCEVKTLGAIPYADGLAMQERAVERLRSGEGHEQLFLLEHPHVLTLGRGADGANILASGEQLLSHSIEVHKTGRGGDVTYHGRQARRLPYIDLRHRPLRRAPLRA